MLSYKFFSIAKWLAILFAITIAACAGFIVGMGYKENSVHQANAFHTQNYQVALNYMDKGDGDLLLNFLQQSYAISISFLPNPDDLSTVEIKESITKVFYDARCYGEKTKWENISPHARKIVNQALTTNFSEKSVCSDLR